MAHLGNKQRNRSVHILRLGLSEAAVKKRVSQWKGRGMWVCVVALGYDLKANLNLMQCQTCDRQRNKLTQNKSKYGACAGWKVNIFCELVVDLVYYIYM